MSGLLPRPLTNKQKPRNESKLLSIDDDDAEEVFSTLSATMTRKILSELYDTPHTASDLSEEVDTSIQNTKYHLEKLQESDLIDIIDTRYSSSGREMNVYAPTNKSLVLFATESGNESTLRESLSRLVGSIVILAIVSRSIDYFIQLFREPQSQNINLSLEVTSSAKGTVNPMIYLSVGDLIFILGLFIIFMMIILRRPLVYGYYRKFAN
ncbi:ArsR/SmtB family transcription factor [Halobium palmae]|uniref:ArsR/SmtB family transcription factor n=1 Tax=Halobium palmae TaxID=1776492 RepID=A0ABD5RWI1_9EURY